MKNLLLAGVLAVSLCGSSYSSTNIGIDIVNNDRNSALHLAIELDDFTTAGILLDAGADITLKDRKGMTPLLELYSKGSSISDWVTSAGDFNNLLSEFTTILDGMLVDPNGDGITFLEGTALTRAQKDARDAITGKESVSTRDGLTGKTILHYSAIFSDKARWDSGTSDVDSDDKYPIDHIIGWLQKVNGDDSYFGFSDKDITSFLNAVDSDRNTALHYSIENNQFDAFQKLLTLGADITLKDRQGMTPLLELYSKGPSINWSINPDITSQQFNNLLVVFTTILEDMLEDPTAGASGVLLTGNALKSAQKSARDAITGKEIASRGGLTGKTILHYAAIFSDSAVYTVSGNDKYPIDYIVGWLQKKIDGSTDSYFGFSDRDITSFADTVDSDRNTALHYAVANDQIDAVEKLIALGANRTLKDQDGNTPLHLAISSNLPNRDEIIQALVN